MELFLSCLGWDVFGEKLSYIRPVKYQHKPWVLVLQASCQRGEVSGCLFSVSFYYELMHILTNSALSCQESDTKSAHPQRYGDTVPYVSHDVLVCMWTTEQFLLEPPYPAAGTHCSDGSRITHSADIILLVEYSRWISCRSCKKENWSDAGIYVLDVWVCWVNIRPGREKTGETSYVVSLHQNIPFLSCLKVGLLLGSCKV